MRHTENGGHEKFELVERGKKVAPLSHKTKEKSDFLEGPDSWGTRGETRANPITLYDRVSSYSHTHPTLNN